MKNVLIIENSASKLKPIMESAKAADGTKDYVLGGIFTEFDVKNRNERIYTASKFLPHLEELNERITSNPGVVYGEFDHPDNFDISLSRISHVITKAEFVKEENLVRGEIKLLSTKYGTEAKAIINDGFPIFVSSRAAGVTEANGVVNLKKLFTYDAVADPGFGSAKMEAKGSLNESLGFGNNSNFRIFDLSDDIKTNELFEMNKNEMVTKDQLVEYSKYLTGELSKMQAQLESVTTGKTGSPDFAKMQKMITEYDNMQLVQEKLVGYVNYLSSHLTHVLIENKSLKTKQDNIVEHNNYLADEIAGNAKNAEMIAEHVFDNKELLSTVNEDVKDLGEYSNYLSEHLSKTIEYAEYITENLVSTIEFTDYLSENLDASIAFTDYLSENLDANIEMSNYLAEHVETTIEYAEYITENVSDNIEYIDYIAENVDNTIGHSIYIAEKLNKKFGKTEMIKENLEGEEAEAFEEEDNSFMSPEEFMSSLETEEEGTEGEEAEEAEGEEANSIISCTRDEEGNLIPADLESGEEELQDVADAGVSEMPLDDENSVEAEEETGEEMIDTDPMLSGITAGNIVKIEGTVDTAKVLSVSDEGVVVEMTNTGEQTLKQPNEIVSLNDDGTEKSLTDEVSSLIEEAKKREASKDVDPHFFTFLNENQKTNFTQLTENDQEKIKVAINESDGYFCQSDVLKLMYKALEVETETLEEKLVKNMPEDIKPIWENLDAKTKNGVFAQARIHNLNSTNLIDHFWRTRKQLKDNSTMLTEGRKTIDSDIIDNSELDNSVIDMFKNKFDSLK